MIPPVSLPPISIKPPVTRRDISAIRAARICVSVVADPQLLLPHLAPNHPDDGGPIMGRGAMALPLVDTLKLPGLIIGSKTHSYFREL
jgi:hypothetical protein